MGLSSAKKGSMDRARGRVGTGRRWPLVVAGLGLLAALLSACSSPHVTAVPAKPGPRISETTSCAQGHPATWMGCLVKADPAFGRRPISGLAIPGSANAGTFNLDPDNFDTQAGSACTEYVPQDTSLGGTTLERWFETQNDSITEQLDLGVRFLDLQVAYNGDHSATQGWHVVQSEYSELPLFDYLDQVAAWAHSHPSELVVVDLRNVCFDNRPDRAIDEGLFASFATPSDVGGGSTTLAQVAFDPGTSSRSLASDTIDQVVQQRGRGHNVVVLLPSGLKGSAVLSSKYHVQAVFTRGAGSSVAASKDLPVELADVEVTPTSTAMFAAANSQLASYPLTTTPKMGSLVGRGLYEADLAYNFDPSNQTALLAGFGGLILPYTPPVTTGVPGTLPAWEAGLWNPTAPGALSFAQILAGWGHRANVVLADGVEDAGFIPAVIGLNAR